MYATFIGHTTVVRTRNYCGPAVPGTVTNDDLKLDPPVGAAGRVIIHERLFLPWTYTFVSPTGERQVEHPAGSAHWIEDCF
jgi:hypothetical protein